jgi:hypothetical protein
VSKNKKPPEHLRVRRLINPKKPNENCRKERVLMWNVAPQALNFFFSQRAHAFEQLRKR